MIDCGNQIDTQTHNKVVNIFSLLLNKPIQGVINIHPAYNSLMLSLDYDVDILDVVKKIKIFISDNTFIEKELKRNIVNIPVCYDPSIGPDLMRVCELNNLTIGDVIRLHTSKKYLVYFIGFTLILFMLMILYWFSLLFRGFHMFSMGFIFFSKVCIGFQ